MRFVKNPPPLTPIILKIILSNTIVSNVSFFRNFVIIVWKYVKKNHFD